MYSYEEVKGEMYPQSRLTMVDLSGDELVIYHLLRTGKVPSNMKWSMDAVMVSQPEPVEFIRMAKI